MSSQSSPGRKLLYRSLDEVTGVSIVCEHPPSEKNGNARDPARKDRRSLVIFEAISSGFAVLFMITGAPFRLALCSLAISPSGALISHCDFTAHVESVVAQGETISASLEEPAAVVPVR